MSWYCLTYRLPSTLSTMLSWSKDCTPVLGWRVLPWHGLNRIWIIVRSQLSSKMLTLVIPQGSVLGPLLFSLFVAPTEDSIITHGLQSMIFADDTQMYLVMRGSWMTENKWMCNSSKTEIVHFTSRHLPHQPIPSMNIAGCLIKRSVSALDLGVTLDQYLTTSTQCESSLQVCIFCPQAYWYNSPQYLNQASTEKLIHAFFSSKLDYCYSLLYGHPDKRNLSRNLSVFRTQLLDWLQKLERGSHNSNSP